MGTRKHLRPHIIFVAATLLVSVPLLAFLQYRWLGQLGEQERDRMQGNLQMAAFHFARLFNEEILALFRAVREVPLGSRDELPLDLTIRIEEWQSRTPHGQLLDSVQYIRRTRGVDSIWTLDGIRFREAGIGSDTAVWMSLDDPASGWLRVTLRRGEPLFVRHDLRGFLVPLGGREQGRDNEGFLFARINRAYLRETLIPEAAGTTLNPGGTTDFDVCVVTHTTPPEVLYSTLPDGGLIPPDNADVHAGLLVFPPRPPSPDAGPPGGEMPGGERRFEGWRPFPFGGERRDSAGMDLMARRPEGEREGSLRGANAVCELRVRHRAGSLEAAVRQSRLRNLAISSGILVLMLVALAILLVSSHRSQRLAEQQIAFVAGVSHELRTPLAVLQSVGENLADGVVTNAVRIRSYGNLIRSEVQRLTVVAENALAYAGIHSGKQQYLLSPILVSEVITKAVSGCHAMMMEAGVQANVDQQDPGVQVSADAGALVSALQNIVSNAVKYRGDSQQIDIVVRNTDKTEDAAVRISVADHGLGIDPRDIPHVFEPFYRGKTAQEMQIRGNGLGLNLAQHIVRAHGGSITVHSAPGQGSTFIVQLPIHSPTHPPT
jgi:signal transduction histidine kinase